MSDKPGSRGPGSLGTPTNSPVIDSGTSARTQNKPNVPQGTKERDWFKEDVYYPLGAPPLSHSSSSCMPCGSPKAISAPQRIALYPCAPIG